MDFSPMILPVSVLRLAPIFCSTIFVISVGCPVASITALALTVNGSICKPDISTELQFNTIPLIPFSLTIKSSIDIKLNILRPAWVAFEHKVDVHSIESTV